MNNSTAQLNINQDNLPELPLYNNLFATGSPKMKQIIVSHFETRARMDKEYAWFWLQYADFYKARLTEADQNAELLEVSK